MTKLPRFLLRASLVAFAPVAANAAGTYYNGNYQSPQSRYNTQTYAQRGYSNYNTNTQSRNYNTGYSNSGNYSSYASTRPVVGTRTTQTQYARTTNSANTTNNTGKKQGFWVDAGISHEFAQWQFEMKQSASILHYDNIGWNVFDMRGGYVFGGNTKMQVDAGFRYGIQSGDSSMVDDDITNGGYLVTTWVDSSNNIIGNQIGHALSVGTSSGGNMMGFNIGFGLTDFFKLGNVKITPSVGYRYLKYKLETKNNYGLSVDTAACFRVNGSDEIQCDPAIVIHLSDGQQQIIWRDSLTGKMQVASGAEWISSEGSYYYEQPGTSHSYEVEWSGPYVALDMDYAINQNNSINGRVELGLPGYTATGDQPYRLDWAHPKSVEDSAGMASGLHLGLGTNWVTAITNTVSLSVGLTYDYYTVSDAEAKTYLNGSYYDSLYAAREKAWTDAGKNLDDILDPTNGDPVAINIKELESQCSGWTCTAENEVKSFYKSMGIRVGINAKF